MTAPDPRAHPEIEDATIERMADELVDGKRHPTADRLSTPERKCIGAPE